MSISKLLSSILLAIVGATALYVGVYFAKIQFSEKPIDPVQLQFSLNDSSGKLHDSSAWNGKVMLVNFWATWCAPCREEMPMLMDFQNRHAQQGLQIIGIALDDAESVQRFSDNMGINYPLLIADETTADLMHKYDKTGAIPFSVITDTENKVVKTKLGIFTAQELLAMIKPLLSVKPKH